MIIFVMKIFVLFFSGYNFKFAHNLFFKNTPVFMCPAEAAFRDVKLSADQIQIIFVFTDMWHWLNDPL